MPSHDRSENRSQALSSAALRRRQADKAGTGDSQLALTWARSALLLLVVLVAATACGYSWAAKRVTLVVDDTEIVMVSLRRTVAGVLKQAGVSLHEADQMTPGPDEPVGDGEIIRIRRAFPVTIVADGAETAVATTSRTVSGLLAEAGVKLAEHDRIDPPAEALLEPDLTIRVVRVIHDYETEVWRIASKVTRREVDRLPQGVSEVVQQGQDGLEEVTFVTVFEDGIEVGRDLVERAVVRQPVSRILHVGTAGKIVRDGQLVEYRRALSMIATAYYWGPECTGKWADGYTYTGLEAKKGVIAVDPRVIPLGTKVYVEGYGFAIAGDIGGAIKGNRIDLCFDTLEEVHAYGMRRVTLYILW